MSSTVWSRLFPEICPACSGETIEGFCRGCRADFTRLSRPCAVCGLPEDDGGECPARGSEWRIARVLAPYAYAYPLRHYLHALKFSHGRRLGRALGLLLADAIGAAELEGSALLAVPLAPRRLRERGYNQALEIARTLGAALGIRILRGGIERIGGADVPQSSLGARARRSNVAHVYRAEGDFEGRSITLVDDVVTTGATINAAAAALLGAGAARVDAVAVARTPASLRKADRPRRPCPGRLRQRAENET
jgi:ComF family protein